MPVLHITNGDSAGEIIKKSDVAGDVLPWRDPMHHGPFPEDVDLDQLSAMRATYLAGPDPKIDRHLEWFKFRDGHLKAPASHDRVVLWFEHDLLDQLQILQILDGFRSEGVNESQLEIICINQFPGIKPFRGIGQLTPVQMASLYDHRKPVTKAMIELASKGWAAFRSPNPKSVLEYLEDDLEALPFLRAALERYLEEFPSVRTGLTRTEHQVLELVHEGVCDPVDLFLRNMDCETRLFIGDTRTYSVIFDLCMAGYLTCEPNDFWHPPLSKSERMSFRRQKLALTEQARSILDGKSNAVESYTRDQWLGGVHLKPGEPVWMWDADQRTLVQK